MVFFYMIQFLFMFILSMTVSKLGKKKKTPFAWQNRRKW